MSYSDGFRGGLQAVAGAHEEFPGGTALLARPVPMPQHPAVRPGQRPDRRAEAVDAKVPVQVRAVKGCGEVFHQWMGVSLHDAINSGRPRCRLHRDSLTAFAVEDGSVHSWLFCAVTAAVRHVGA